MPTDKLRQPTKFSHNILQQNPNSAQQQKSVLISNESNQHKSSQLNYNGNHHKLADRKVINKKFEPSAIRLQAINRTFHRISDHSDSLLNQFNICNGLLSQFMDYHEKVKCGCGRNIRFYCLKCMSKNEQLQFPFVQLPVEVTVLHHKSEKVCKSSILPTAFLSKQIHIQFYEPNRFRKPTKQSKKIQKLQRLQQQQLHQLQGLQQLQQTKTSPILNNLRPQQTYILFPHKKSMKVTKQLSSCPSFKNLVILDCTWFQTDQLIAQLENSGFTNFLRLENYQSLYWRYNHHSDKALSSAESLAYFLREYQQSLAKNKKQYDNIMFLYHLNLKIVVQSYRQSAVSVSE